jgi:CheY-like chemotaxis protein
MLILAVDDDADDLELFRDALRHIDPSIKLMTATNGEEALSFLSKDTMVSPDLIFLDINMPRIDGRECLKFIKSENFLKRIPVIMLSTTVSAEDKEAFKKQGASFITKESTFEAQVESLTRVLKALESDSVSQGNSLSAYFFSDRE